MIGFSNIAVKRSRCAVLPKRQESLSRTLPNGIEGLTDSLLEPHGFRRELAKAETPKNRIPGGRPEQARSTRRRIRPRARFFRPAAGGGGPGLRPENGQNAYFYSVSPSAEHFWSLAEAFRVFGKPQSRGQRHFQTVKRGGSEGFDRLDGSGESLKDSGK